MSIDAPWLALTIDWMHSRMFDKATPAARLAWVYLLCWVKAYGRGGRAKVRAELLSKHYSISVRSIDEMLKTARKHKAITVEDDVVTICNWRTYQDPRSRQRPSKSEPFSKMAENDATPHPSPLTPHPSPCTKKEVASATCPEPPKPATSGPPAKPDPSILDFPCVGKVPTWSLTAAKLAEWVDLYPNLDVPFQVRKARQWLTDNPKRGKTARGMTRYLGNWLANQTDNGRRGPPASGAVTGDARPQRIAAAKELKRLKAEQDEKEQSDA